MTTLLPTVAANSTAAGSSAVASDGLTAVAATRLRRVFDDLSVILVLFFLVGHVLVGEEQVLGAEQADAGGADLARGLGVGQVVDVGQQLDL